jgi:hypothetical protein
MHLCSVASLGDALVTVSEDGRSKMWMLSTGKCSVDRVIECDDRAGARLIACKVSVLPGTDQVGPPCASVYGHVLPLMTRAHLLHHHTLAPRLF